MRSPRQLLQVRGWALRYAAAITLLVLALSLIVRPEAQDELRTADQLFQRGSYHAALQIYARLSANPSDGEAALRLAAVRLVRGEHALAERALRQALKRSLPMERHELALLFLGQALVAQGNTELGARTWHLLEQCEQATVCPWRGPQRILMAEQALVRGDYAAAEADFIRALEDPLPDDWASVATYRLALLRAARGDLLFPEQASFTLPTPQNEPLLVALLPRPAGDLAQLQAILASDPAQRAQMLGQFYFNLRLFSLAEAQFNQVDPASPDALAATAYAAYIRWLGGDRQGGLERLEELVERYPDEPRARTLLAVAYMAENQGEDARSQIETISKLSPISPDTRLAWASWYAAQRDYVLAADEYRMALVQAPEAEKGRYALVGAQFHLKTAYELCSAGLPLAESAVIGLPNDATALTTLAAHRYHCGNFAGAANSARAALALNPGADAAYYLGAALVAMGELRQARGVLVQAADLAPASEWRIRAEEVLGRLPREVSR
jgi:tetratricopeptide (TPR) repeat protein